MAAIVYQAAVTVTADASAAVARNVSSGGGVNTTQSGVECGCRVQWPRRHVSPRGLQRAPPAPSPRLHRRPAALPGSVAGARPLAPAGDPKGPSEAERLATQTLVWLHMGRHRHEIEPFYDDEHAGVERGPELDAMLSDESLAHADSRSSNVWANAGDPSDRGSFQFGPLSNECRENHHSRFWSLVAAHYDFWLPFSLTAYLFAPLMGFVFYCMIKGADHFGVCMDRLFQGASIFAALRELYGGKPDPWAGRSPADDK